MISLLPTLPDLDGVRSLLLSALVVFNVIWIYNFALSLRALTSERRLPPATRHRRFAVLIPAHNEETVIGNLIDNIRAQDYPSGLIQPFVAADNCTDATATVAAAHGAEVLVRSGGPRRGKTWNVRWALGQLPLDDVDVVVMIDADNIVADDYFARMNDYYDAHPDAEVVQGYLDSKNPHDSWVTRAYALAYWYGNRFYQLARSRWHLSAQLGGTGAAFTVGVLQRVGWDLESLTEDLEFTCRYILQGGRVHWNEWAVTYDEKPVTLGVSGRQRLRWMRGHYWCLWRYGGRVIVKFFTTGRLQFLDLFIYLSTPGRNSIAYTMMLGGVLVPIVRTIADPLWVAKEPLGAAWLGWTLYTVVHTGLRVVIGPSLHQRRLTVRYLPDTLTFLWWGLTWFPFLVLGLVTARNQRTWTKTRHTRALALEEVVGFTAPRRR